MGVGYFGEGKGDGGILVEFWSLWLNKWRWRRKKMMVGSCNSYSCSFSCSGMKKKLVVIRVFDGER